MIFVSVVQLDRYKDIHARGIIHNGIKPGNICLSPADSDCLHKRSMLYVIDFGLSFAHDIFSQDLLPSSRRTDTVGNRSFISIYGHHGISMFTSIFPSNCFPSINIIFPKFI